MVRRLLLTGGTGLLGRRVWRRAEAAGWEVVAPPRATLDVSDPVAVAAAVRTVRPSAVVHTAYVQQGEALAAVTARAPGSVAEAAAAGGARLVHLSSDVVFAGRDEPYTESDPPDPVHDYGRAKATAEELVVAAGGRAVVVRTSLLVGDDDGAGPQEALAADPSARFFVDEWRRPVAAGEVAAAVLRLLAQDVSGPVHLVGPELLSRYELAERLAPPGAALRPGRRADVPGARPGRLDLANTRLAWWDPAPVAGRRGGT